MEQVLSGKNALVVGGSRGIGKAICNALAENGANVVVNYNHSSKAAEEVAQTISERGGHAQAIGADVSQVAEIAGLFDRVEQAFGKLDFVIANAAVAINKPVLEYTVADFEKTFNLNTRGTFFIMQEAAKRINDNGRIIAMSSGGTKLLLSGTTLYLGSKGAVEQFVRGFSQEVGARNITVNNVSPGYTATEMLKKNSSTDALKDLAAQSPFNRLGEPADIANVVAFLCSPQASWITGQNIGVGGGVM